MHSTLIHSLMLQFPITVPRMHVKYITLWDAEIKTWYIDVTLSSTLQLQNYNQLPETAILRNRFTGMFLRGFSYISQLLSDIIRKKICKCWFRRLQGRRHSHLTSINMLKRRTAQAYSINYHISCPWVTSVKELFSCLSSKYYVSEWKNRSWAHHYKSTHQSLGSSPCQIWPCRRSRFWSSHKHFCQAPHKMAAGGWSFSGWRSCWRGARRHLETCTQPKHNRQL